MAAYRTGCMVGLLLLISLSTTVSSLMKNCYNNLPLKIDVNIPDKITQRVTQPLDIELRASIRDTEVLKAPFTLVIDVRKEWFAGFWSTVPCVNFGYKNCKMIVTPEMIKTAGYDYPIRETHVHTRTKVSLQSIPDYLLQGNYKITLVLWTFTPHKKLLACVRGNLSLNIVH